MADVDKKRIPSPYGAVAFEALVSALEEETPSIGGIHLFQRKAAEDTACVSLKQFKKYSGGDFPQSEPPSPLFVTWNVLSSSALASGISQEDDKLLRGCIGNFSELPVESGIREYALISAFEDPRFDPITQSELETLECSITLLRNFEKADNCLDWELGKHGVRIQISAPGSRRKMSATFLPQVAVEQKWDKEQTLAHLIRKAGCPAGSSWRDYDIQLTRYEGLKSCITYSEYVSLKDQVTCHETPEGGEIRKNEALAEE